MSKTEILSVNKLKQEYSKRKSKIKQRLKDFSSVPQKDYFYEFCFCLLTPQSSAYRCWDAVVGLKKDDFLNKDVHPKKHLGKVRFHNNKSKYLLEWKDKHQKIITEIIKTKNSYNLREFLVENIKGMGYKEASHFLRNIGRRNLAILDRHILKNLVKYGAMKELPKSMAKKQYFEIEKKFMKFADKIGIPMDELDLLFWSMETGKVFK